MIMKLTRRAAFGTALAASLVSLSGAAIAQDQMTFTMATAGSETDARSVALAEVFASVHIALSRA